MSTEQSIEESLRLYRRLLRSEKSQAKIDKNLAELATLRLAYEAWKSICSEMDLFESHPSVARVHDEIRRHRALIGLHLEKEPNG